MNYELLLRAVLSCFHGHFCYRTLWHIFKEQKSTHLRNFLLDQNQSPIQLSPAGQQKLLYCLQFGDRLGSWSSPRWKYYIPDSICVFVLFSKNTLRKIPKRKNCKWKTNIPRQSCVEFHAWNWAEKFEMNCLFQDQT